MSAVKNALRNRASRRAAYFLWSSLLAFPGLAVFAASADAAITFRQINYAVPQTPQATVSVPFAAAQTAGGLNVVAIGWFNTTANILSVTDTSNNTYVLAAGPTTQAQAGTQAMYYASNIVAAPAGSNTVTVTFDAAVPYADVRIAEYSGIDPVNALDISAEGAGTGTTSSTGSVTTSNADNLLVGANFVTTSTTAAGTGYTARVITSPNGSILEDRVVTSTGSYNAGATLNSGSWIMQMVAFRGVSGGPPDTQAPTAPTNLAVTPASSTTLGLSWTAGTDNVGVTGYQIERCTGAGCSNFTLLTTVATTSHDDTGLTAATTYRYRVRATDLAGNLSDYSAVVNGTPLAGPPAAIVFQQSNYAVQQSSSCSGCHTSKTTASAAFTGAQTAGGLNVVAIGWFNTTANILSVTDTSNNSYVLAAGPTTQAGTQAMYYAANIVAAPAGSNTVTVTFDQGVARSDLRIAEYSGIDPLNPFDVGIAGTGSGTTSNSGSVTTTNANNLLVGASYATTATTAAGSGYTERIITNLRGSILEDRVVTSTGSYNATAALNSGDWIMQMAAFRAADSQAPTAPTNLAVTPASSTALGLSWTAATDNVGVTGYQIERCTGIACSDYALLTTVTTTSHGDTGLTAGTTYRYRVRATDLAGNLSDYSAVVSGTPLAGPPAAIVFQQSNYAVPQTPQASVSVPFTSTQFVGDLNVVAIGWFNTTANILSVTDTSNNSYVLAAGPTTQAQAGTQAMYYAANIAGATPGSNSVTVTFDAAVPYPDVRIAEYSGIDPVNTVDVGAEGTGTGTTSDSGSVTTTSANDLLVGANFVTTSTTAAGAGYVERIITSPNGSILEDRVVTSTGSYNATATLNAGSWIMQMLAFRAASAGPPDTQAPTAPANLAVTPASNTTLNLSWPAASDNIGVTGYQIERCTGELCSNFTPLTTVATTSYNNTGLAASTSYSYRVRAVDGSGNLSGYSPTGTATTLPGPDVEPPSISISMPAAGATLAGTVTLMATGSDNTGIAGVQFQIDGLNVGAPDTAAPYSLSFATTQLANGAHSITAYAWDAQRNVGNSAAVGVTFSNANPANPAQVGFWGGLSAVPLVAIHVSLMPNGRVLTWDQMAFGYPDPVVWDPLTSSTTTVPIGDGTNVFCAGFTTLRDGRVLLAGGEQGAGHVGTRTGRIFDPTSNTWSATPDMTQGRWYPTLTMLADGRVLTLSGETFCKGCYALVPEIYDPVTNNWSQLTSAARTLTWYPHVTQLGNGKIVVTGTSEAPSSTITLDLDTQIWSTVDSRVLESGGGVNYAPGKFLNSGTSTDAATNLPSTAAARVLDMNAPNPAWRTIASMAFPRAYHVLTMLPDGNVLATGGGRTTAHADLANAVYEAELWSPTTESWTTLSAMHAPRLYHGVALLLPDARVLISGGGRGYGMVAPSDQTTAEVFAPPYLFKGPRPTISSAPSQLTYGQDFSVQTPDAATIASVSLISLGSMTHAYNQNQRYLSLPFVAGGGSLTVTAPAATNVAPPGYYMLFIVGTNGAPSVASIVRL